MRDEIGRVGVGSTTNVELTQGVKANTGIRLDVSEAAQAESDSANVKNPVKILDGVRHNAALNDMDRKAKREPPEGTARYRYIIIPWPQ
jgi:hypothetical protein